MSQPLCVGLSKVAPQVDVETMRVAAENAETNQFNGAVDAASGAEGS